MSMTVTGSTETSSLGPTAISEAKPVLNSFCGHRLSEVDKTQLINFMTDASLIANIIFTTIDSEPNSAINIKELLKSLTEKPLLRYAPIRAVAGLCILGSAAVFPITKVALAYFTYAYSTGQILDYIDRTDMNEKVLGLIEELWKGIDQPEEIQLPLNEVKIFGFTTDHQTGQNLLFHLRIVAIAGKILKLDGQKEINSILKVMSEFVDFKKNDLKKLEVTSSEDHYYQDGDLCDLYGEILNQQKNQWNDPEQMLKIIQTVATHKRRIREISNEEENKNFPCYYDPKISLKVNCITVEDEEFALIDP